MNCITGMVSYTLTYDHFQPETRGDFFDFVKRPQNQTVKC